MLTKLSLLCLVFLCIVSNSYGQLFQDDFGSAFASIDGVKWPSGCRGGTASSFNTSAGACYSASDYNYGTSGFGTYITSQGIAIPSTGYELSFEYSFNYSLSFPAVEIRTGASCGTTLIQTETLSNTSGVCTPYTVNLDAYAGQTIYIRLRSNTSSATTYWDDILVDVGSGGGGSSCLLEDNFGTTFQSISTTNWPTSCRTGSPTSFNTSSLPCASAGDYGYSMSGFQSITSMALAIPSTGYSLDFEYSFNYSFSFPSVEIRTGGTCGTSLAQTVNLTNTSGVCTPQSVDLSSYAGQTIFIRFRSNTSSATFYLDEVTVCGTASSGDYKWADNFNDNDLDIDYAGNDGDEACTGCGQWNMAAGATLELVPSAGWNGNTNKTEAFPSGMSNVYYVKLDRNEWIESPTIDMSGKESLKISFYAKSSSSGTGGGDSWSSFSDKLKLQIWDGSSWITVKQITEGTSVEEDQILPALPFNYFCFSAYKTSTSPGNYYYTSTPNVNSAYFHSDFKFRVIFEDGFSGAPFAWVDDFTFRADADGYSTMVPCGVSFWNQPAATSYGQDPGATAADDSERGVELELDNSINIPPLWNTEANDGDAVSQVFGAGESERVVFAVISEQEINFAFPVVYFYAPSMGWQSAVMSKDPNYTGPGWRYYSVQYVSCDLAGGSIAEPTDDYRYYYAFEYGNEFIPVFYHLNKSGIETGGGVTSSLEVFNAPDVISTDVCGTALGVSLMSFDAIAYERSVYLTWNTASEWNNDHFDIQRSINGVDFENIGSVVGSGTTNEQMNYHWTDEHPYQGTSFYRVVQVDTDGAKTNSDIRSVIFSGDQEIKVFPVPAETSIIVQLNAEQIENVVSSQGISVQGLIRLTNTSEHTTLINIEDLSAGVYFIQTVDDVIRFIKK